MNRKKELEDIIRTLGLEKTQAGYEQLLRQTEYYVGPAEYCDLITCVDWLSQDGYEGI